MSGFPEYLTCCPGCFAASPEGRPGGSCPYCGEDLATYRRPDDDDPRLSELVEDSANAVRRRLEGYRDDPDYYDPDEDTFYGVVNHELDEIEQAVHARLLDHLSDEFRRCRESDDRADQQAGEGA